MFAILAVPNAQRLYKTIVASKETNYHMQINKTDNNIKYLDLEVQELKQARTKKEVKEELGDVFYSACNVAFAQGFTWFDIFKMLNTTVEKVKNRLHHIELNNWDRAWEMSWRQKWDASK